MKRIRVGRGVGRFALKFRSLLVNHGRFSPGKENARRLRRKKGTRVSASPRFSPAITASAPRTPGGLDGEAGRRALPGAAEFRFFSGYECFEETDVSGASPRLPS